VTKWIAIYILQVLKITDFSIFLFSKGNKVSSREIRRENQKMVWMSLTPNTNLKDDSYNDITNELVKMIKKI
jgi:hypothetical protein